MVYVAIFFVYVGCNVYSGVKLLFFFMLFNYLLYVIVFLIILKKIHSIILNYLNKDQND